MALADIQAATRVCFPEAYRPIAATRNKTASIGTQTHRSYATFMPLEDMQTAIRACIPQAYGSIIAARNEPAPIGTQTHGSYRTAFHIEGVQGANKSPKGATNVNVPGLC